MKINKKALTAAITLSVLLGTCGAASAETLYGASDHSTSGKENIDDKVVAYTYTDKDTPERQTYVTTETSVSHYLKSVFEVKGGSWDGVYGGYWGGEIAQDAEYNTVTISGDACVSSGSSNSAYSVTGGYTANGSAHDNKVIMNGGTVDALNGGRLGYSSNGDASYNTAILNGGQVRIIRGGYTGSGAASANRVTLLGGEVTFAVYGGEAETTNNNEVNIGGYKEGDTINRSAAALDLTKARIEGGTNNTGGTGNTLNVFTVGNKALYVRGFQNYNFYLPAATTAAMLATSSDIVGIDLSGAAINTLTTDFTPGKEITLLSSAKGITTDAATKYMIDGTAVELGAVWKQGDSVEIAYMTNVKKKIFGYTYDDNDNPKALSFGRVNYYLADNSTVGVKDADVDETIKVTLDTHLDADSKNITIYKGYALNAKQGISNAGTITNDGTLNLGADSALGSIVYAKRDGETKITGGTTTVSGDVKQGSIKISEGACYKQTGGTAIWGAYFSNYGTVQFSLPGNFGIAPTVNGNGKTEILAGNVSANNFTQGELLVAEGAGFTCNESFKVDQITNNGTLSRGGSSYNNTAGSIDGTGTTSLTGTLTVNGNFTQKGLTVGEGGNYTQTAGHFVVNGEVTNSGTVTLQNLGGTATKDFTAAENKVTGTLTNNGTFTLDNTNLTVNAFAGNTVKVENESKLTIVNGDIPSGGGDITGDLKVTSGSTAEIVAPTVVHGDLNVDETSTLKVEGTSLTATENGAKVTIGTLTGDGKGELKLSACNVMQEGLVNIGNAAQIAINVAPVGATVLEGVENLDAAIANINAKGIDALVKNLGEGASFNLQEGAIYGETSYIGSASGKATKISKPNTANQAVSNACSSAAAFGRIEMNDIRKRLGDVRLAEAEDGFWTRYENGKLQGLGTTSTFNKIQVGGDHKVSDKWRIGGAFSYTNANANYSVGHNDSKTYSLAAYGAYYGTKGEYADIIARVGKNDTDMDFFTAGGVLRQQGSLTTWSQALSAELGKTYGLKHNLFIEPQAELSYTHSGSGDFTSNGYTYKLDAMNSLNGRLGFAFGYQAPDKKGALYTRLSILHEFCGDRDFIVSKGALAGTTTANGSDTWYEWAIGGQLRTSRSTYIYADIEKTFKANMDEKYRATLGLRYSF